MKVKKTKLIRRYFIESLSLIILTIIVLIIYHNFKINTLTITAIPKPSPVYEAEKVKNFDIPILMYHYIGTNNIDSPLGERLSVSPYNFDAQIKFLFNNDYQTVKLEDLADPQRITISNIYLQKKKPIVLTFDDGYNDAYLNAFPILKKYHFNGTFFLIEDNIGDSRYLSQTQIDKMKEAGMEFGSHTLSHPDLTKISIENAKIQILDSKNGYTSFCYPSGKFNDGVVNLVKDSGYKVAVTTKIGVARENSDLFRLPRVRIENTNLQDFINNISHSYEYETN